MSTAATVTVPAAGGATITLQIPDAARDQFLTVLDENWSEFSVMVRAALRELDEANH